MSSQAYNLLKRFEKMVAEQLEMQEIIDRDTDPIVQCEVQTTTCKGEEAIMQRVGLQLSTAVADSMTRDEALDHRIDNIPPPRVFLFAVRLEKVKGEAGNAETPPTFRYRMRGILEGGGLMAQDAAPAVRRTCGRVHSAITGTAYHDGRGNTVLFEAHENPVTIGDN